MELHEDNLGKQAPQEELRHSQNEIVIGLTKSPGGKPCIGMTFEGEEWIFFTAKIPILADRMRQQLQQELGISSLVGFPFDWRASLEQQKLVLYKDSAKLNKPVGIFVPADHFDNLVASSFGT